MTNAFCKTRGGVSLVLLFFRGPQRGQRAVEETEGRREDRWLQRRKGVIEGKRAVEDTEGCRGAEGPKGDRGL